LTLRTRLLLALVALTAIGLAVAGMITYRQQQTFLIQRVDTQLADAQSPMQFGLTHEYDGRHDAPPGLTYGFYGEFRDANGQVLPTPLLISEQGRPTLVPPKLANSIVVNTHRYFGAHAVHSGTHYRVLAVHLSQQQFSNAAILIVAIPLTDVDQTLHHLFLVEILVAAAVLLAMALLAWWVVRLELKPLENMGSTAGAIAAGDLSRRVEPADERSEVGRLGLALNSMLGQIEVAFAERTASEARLRRFVADASHELRTPLTSIRGYAELFRRGAASRPDDLAKTMTRIEEAAARMGVLVEDLLLLARLDQGRPLDRAPVDLSKLVGAAVDDLRAAAPDRSVTYEATGQVVVSGDENRLRQVLANLLENARSHTPPGTPIHVRVGDSGADAVIEVIDQGPGMSADDAARAFERFYRADPSRARESGGAGLGLAIVAAITEAHGGHAEVQTEPGAGATFRIWLPRAGAPQPAAPPSKPRYEDLPEVEV
jgi:two-component system, OmpR family, sensor kinase